METPILSSWKISGSNICKPHGAETQNPEPVMPMGHLQKQIKSKLSPTPLHIPLEGCSHNQDCRQVSQENNSH